MEENTGQTPTLVLVTEESSGERQSPPPPSRFRRQGRPRGSDSRYLLQERRAPQQRPGASNEIAYAAICCRIGCDWRTTHSTPDKLEAIRAGRQHEADHKPELHITTVIHMDDALAAAA